MADYHTPAWRDKKRIGAIMELVERHAKGEHQMTATQLRAAEMFLKKSLPDLANMQVKSVNVDTEKLTKEQRDAIYASFNDKG